MSDVVIRVENLTKEYRLGVINHGTLHQDLQSWWARMRGKEDPNSLISLGQHSSDLNDNPHLLALNDVSFDVKQGEILGIIGRNGAGKSTLLKILSRVTAPTKGSVKIKGRVASLLEVGTGFHPELTGRENIYLNGAILGMTKKEIRSKFDEIVDFAEIEKFIDTPVKRYSSGMYVRLAFAVAAHLEPEILIVDEVLAVGDAAFQKKCLGKMGGVAQEGRTVLFVSHNMATIQALCTRSILLQVGRIAFDGAVEGAINMYLVSAEQLREKQPLAFREDRVSGEIFRFAKVEFLDTTAMIHLNTVVSGQSVSIRLKYLCQAENLLDDVVVSIGFNTKLGTFIFACRSDAVGKTFRIFPGEGFLTCKIAKWPLSFGRYTYNLIALKHGRTLDWVKEAGFVDVETGDYYGTGVLPAHTHQGVFINFDWDSQGKK